MKRVRKISEAAQSELLLYRAASSKPKTLTSQSLFLLTNTSINNSVNRFFSGDFYCSQTSVNSNRFPNIIGLFSDRWSHADIQVKEDLIHKVSVLRDELIRIKIDYSRQDDISRVMNEKGDALLRNYSDGAAFVELLKQLESSPCHALEVFNWRRKQADDDCPMTSEEYAKGIKLAGRLKNVALAVELFIEAANKMKKTSSTYNALLSTYMYNNEVCEKCQLLFRDFKKDPFCKPTIVTYNILLSVFGRLMLIDHMEALLQEMKDLSIPPNLITYNTLLIGYITAWMWDSMEKTYTIMEENGINPNIYTYMLMLRGYAHSGNLKRMEEMYDLVTYHLTDRREFTLIRAMICAYCKSTSTNRVERVEELLRLMPKNDYTPWLNVILIRFYAQEDNLDVMESYINKAFEHNTSVRTIGTMRSIISSYYRGKEVDRLANFMKCAEYADWRICRSLYHCKMVLYSSQKRLAEMEGVLGEMEKVNIHPTKKTFFIMYKAYSECGERHKLDQIAGIMCTYGYGILHNTLQS